MKGRGWGGGGGGGAMEHFPFANSRSLKLYEMHRHIFINQQHLF